MSQKTADGISKLRELCWRGVEVLTEIEHFIAESRQTIEVGKVAIDRLNRLYGPLWDL